MKTTRTILALLGAAALAVAARASTVTLNTSSLAGGTYYVDFQLNDGASLGNGNNSAAAYNFNFGGGTATTGFIGAFGGVTGDLFSTVGLTDTSAFNEFLQSFTAGAFLSFDLLLSNNPESPAPDIFAFALLDENGLNLGTFSLGSDQFLTVELTGGALDYQAFAGVGGIAAPSVPEAGSTALFAAVALFGLAGVRRRLAHARVS